MLHFELSKELFGHKDTARCCIFLENNENGFFAASGGQDNSILLWKLEGDGANDYSTKVIHHSCWITCLLPLTEGKFISGGYDGVIRIYSPDGDILGAMSGHSSGITSLAHGPNDTIISGSWDGSARIWDLHILREVLKMSGMENAVTACALDDSTIVTTSTGVKDAMNGVSGYAVRLWQNGKLMRTQRTHYASIRCCWPYHLKPQLPSASSFESPADGFFTGGNDGKITLYDRKGDVLGLCETPPNVEDKYPFIMKVKSMGGQDVSHLLSACVSEDGCLRLWSGTDCIQIQKHPNSLWDVDVQESVDARGHRRFVLITACSDGVVRLFSTDSAQWLAESYRNKYLNACEEKESQLAAKLGVNIDSLADYSLRSQYPGTREGEIRMFRREDKGYVFKWSTASNTWIEIGELLGTADETHKIPIEVETPSGYKRLELEYHDNDNAYEVAQDFIDKNGLQQEYLEEIAQYIMNNRRSSKVTLGAPKETSQKTFTSDVFPERRFIQHDKLAVEGIQRKMRQFNSTLESESERPTYILRESDISELDSLIISLGDASKRHEPLRESDIHLLRELLTWPHAYLFPVFDIIKNAVFRPGGSIIFNDRSRFSFESFLREIHVTETPRALFIVLFRLFANVLCVEEHQWVMDLLPIMLQDKMIFQSMTSFLLNASIVLGKKASAGTNDADLEVSNQLISVECDIVNQCSDEVTLDRAITAICNVLITSPKSCKVIDEGVKQHIQLDQFTDPSLNHKYKEALRLILSLDS